jgi:hypothetical protein
MFFPMLSAQQQRFCAVYATDGNAAAAYRAAYPSSSEAAANTSASRLLKNADIQAEVSRIRNAATGVVGTAVLSIAEKRNFLARLVRARVAELGSDSDLWQSIKTTDAGAEYRLPDKLRAIETDNDLAGDGSTATGNDGIAALIARIRK